KLELNRVNTSRQGAPMADYSNNIVNLRDLSAELLEKAATVKNGRAIHSFRAVPSGHLTQVLLALKACKSLFDHENPGEALLHVLQGTVHVTVGEDAIEVKEDEHAVVPQQRHGLVAVEDSAVLLTVVRYLS